MRIETRLRLIGVISLAACGALVAGVSTLSEAVEERVARATAYTDLFRKVAALDALEYERLFEPNERSRVQWEQIHAALGRALWALDVDDVGEAAKLGRLRRHHADLGAPPYDSLFAGTSTLGDTPLDREIRTTLSRHVNLKLATMLDEVSLLVRENRSHVLAQQRRFRKLALLVLVVTFTAGLALLLSTNRRVETALRELGRGVRAFGAGRLSERVRVGGADELTELAESFNGMAARLEQSEADGVRAAKERERLQVQFAQAQKMESVGRLAGGVAHDFNNMLGVIIGYTEMALSTVDAKDPLHGDLQEVRKAAQRAADLTRQLLAFARKQAIAPKVLDLNEVISDMYKMLRRLVGEEITIEWLPGSGLAQVRIDPSQLDQILANLCVNARDAIAGHGKISITTRTAILDAATAALHPGAAAAEYVVLSVSDDGSGMTPEVQERLFEPFFTTKEAGRGTGLGLATVYGIVQQNLGFITLDSQVGRGSTFEIYLPRHAAQPEVVCSGDLVGLGPRGTETILVVEDEPSTLRVIVAGLDRLGYRVLAASTPTEAVALAAAHEGSIDLLLSDVIMPEMNGRQLAASLRASRPTIEHLFMSGYTSNVIAVHGVFEPGVHFVAKPFPMAELAVKIRDILDRNTTRAPGL
ncbi:ATP-binding protein [Myxococcota bacterium]|nr:ATP-binding protein [Myxococcota bacterium]